MGLYNSRVTRIRPIVNPDNRPMFDETIEAYRIIMYNIREAIKQIEAFGNEYVTNECRNLMKEAAEKFAFSHTKESKKDALEDVYAVYEILASVVKMNQ